jgi:hypothetical protein
MKLTIAFFGIFLAVFSGKASGQTTPYDSAFIESPIIFAIGVTDTSFLLDKPDGSSSHFGQGGEVAGRFRVAGSEITMQKNQPIHIYWNIPTITPGDSNVGYIHLQRLSDDFVPNGDIRYYLKEPSVTNHEGMTTIIVPDTGYNAVAVEIAADSGGNSFWLDAITLVQSGTAAVMDRQIARGDILASYPNPFEHSSVATLHIDAPDAGRGELLVSDALGREVERVPIGELHAGGQDVNFALGRAGVFFARLFIEGAPVGGPLKLVAE